MIKLGVSVYPEQEKLEDIDAYLALASKYGFKKVFTSLFSVPGTKEEVFAYFKEFTGIAHKYGMEVDGDCNTEFFQKMGATENDISVFKELGIDTIRMDFCFKDERDVTLINNKEGIQIELSCAFIDFIDTAIKNGANVENMSACHNFFPERYSGPSLEMINEVNEHLQALGVRTGIFISSQVKGTHGPWPVSDGLPTLEDHRDLPIEVQLKHFLAMNNVDEVIIGNAYASEEEFKKIDEVMKATFVNIPKNEKLGFFADFLPHGNLKRIPFSVNLVEGITDVEREALFGFPTHSDMGDGMYYMLRTRTTRMLLRGKEIPHRPSTKEYFTRGDILIVNDNLAHYRAEVEIVLKDMKNDGQRNLVGRISEDEIMLLDHIKANDVYCFIEK